MTSSSPIASTLNSLGVLRYLFQPVKFKEKSHVLTNEISRSYTINFFALMLSGCTNVDIRNVTEYDKRTPFTKALNNCGNSSTLILPARFTYEKGSSDTNITASGSVTLSSSDIASFKAKVDEKRGNQKQTSDDSLSLNAEPNTNVVYTTPANLWMGKRRDIQHKYR